ncbi:hypothetical protein RHMOL_Rhmol12G0198500 [Rhododendron molle]|uniref:Uncharacterized protein n=1 Tax=Rhododendron molle TaxID=49168 RepID=A0ACC0LLP8_RHOML|nr:hypothetical protein RHMOL_Rhmol12G0198500 [Rhododendron molle]
MQSLYGCIRSVRSHATNSSKVAHFNSVLRKPNPSAGNEVGYVDFVGSAIGCSNGLFFPSLCKFISHSSLELTKPIVKTSLLTSYNTGGRHSVSLLHSGPKPGLVHQSMALQALSRRSISTADNSADSVAQEATASILDKEAVEEVRNQREIPDIRPGYIIQLKVEVPDNKRRVSILKGIVIARRNAGLNTTFRLRRLVAGVGVESLFPLYSPNIKEIKVLDKKKVRRAKLYYLRDKMNALRK